MALDVVTDGKNDKTEKNDQEYVHNKKTRDGTCVLFCVPPSFVLIDNKYSLSGALFQDHAIKAEIIWSYYHLFWEDQNKKNVQLCWQETNNVDTDRRW